MAEWITLYAFLFSPGSGQRAINLDQRRDDLGPGPMRPDPISPAAPQSEAELPVPDTQQELFTQACHVVLSVQ